ncbi:replication-associated protein [Pacific flying fox faeces associated circular DNA virus-1]|nr:replication-associated protein [Pacific flying fox faeces associated circular DNA virus-1]
MQLSRWCFTNFNIPQDLAAGCDAPLTLPSERLKYACYQIEKCPDTGRLHAQGYLHFKRSIKLGGLKKLPGFEAAHFEGAKADLQANRNYCTKEDSRVAGPFEIGSTEGLGPGARSDLLAVKRRLDEGVDEVGLADEFFGEWVKHRASFNVYRGLKVPARGKDTQTPLYVCVGASGLGKSTFVYDETEGTVFQKALTAKWWDGFNGTQPVLFDDFRGAFQFTELLRLANIGAYQVEVKGGSIQFNPKEIWITSNLRPDQWYNPSTIKDITPLTRRISKIYHFTAFKEMRLFQSTENESAWDQYSRSEEFSTLNFNGRHGEATSDLELVY